MFEIKRCMGTVLQQLVHGAWQPLAFLANNFTPEKKYSAFDMELLALNPGLRHL